MKTPVSRFPLVLAGWFVSGAVALAHPGHDDGHELVWDFDHLSAHPVATLICVSVAAVAAVVIWQLVRRRSRIQHVPLSRD